LFKGKRNICFKPSGLGLNLFLLVILPKICRFSFIEVSIIKFNAACTFLLYSYSLMYIFVECFNFTARYLNFSKPLISILDPCRRWKFCSKHIISFSKLAKNILRKLYKTIPVFRHLYLLQNDFELESTSFFQLTYMLGEKSF
jgi:hypothetical protein